jgi:ATPase subunit of ABC transporter with duplicated ATPase domains
MLQAFDLSYSPDPRVGPLFEHICLAINPGDKVALIGRNGSGKSLLLRILAGKLRPATGRVVCASGAQVAYLPQDFDYAFSGTLQAMLDRESAGLPSHTLARAIYRLGLSPLLLRQEYATLSLGEKMRGALAALLAAEPTILLLDEPTNHLDVQAREWLERFLRDSPEGALMVCHDRAVINSVADRVLELDRGALTEYAGGFDDMRAAKELRDERRLEAWQRHRDEDRRLRIAAEEEKQRASDVAKKPTSRTYDPKHKAFYAGKQAKMDKRAKAIRSRVEQLREDAPDKPYAEDTLALSDDRSEACQGIWRSDPL